MSEGNGVEKIEQQVLEGERALFMVQGLEIVDCIFQNGESPLKESKDITVRDSVFRWKYPFWYAKNVSVRDCALLEMARAGMWYCEDIAFEDCTVEAPKGFRKSRGVRLTNVNLADAQETLWWCDDVVLEKVSAKGNYFAMNTNDVTVRDFQLVGNYCFDGCCDVVVENARMLSKDAFWNCENVIVRDSFITGEYLGWNSKNLTFENCVIESLQGLCYIEGLKLVNCRLLNTNLAFEYCSDVDAQVTTTIDSVKNPISGRIEAAGFGEVVFDDPAIDQAATDLVVTA